MNPWRRFHLSFTLGYSSAYERAKGYTGSALIIHGNCVSVGCYTMTDPRIEQIYTLAAAALKAGQPGYRVHAVPFRMTEEKMEKHSDSRWRDFWKT